VAQTAAYNERNKDQTPVMFDLGMIEVDAEQTLMDPDQTISSKPNMSHT
jgi:hypothetical protein